MLVSVGPGVSANAIAIDKDVGVHTEGLISMTRHDRRIGEDEICGH